MKLLAHATLWLALIVTGISASAQSIAVVRNSNPNWLPSTEAISLIDNSIGREDKKVNLVAESCEQKKEAMENSLKKYQTDLEGVIQKSAAAEESQMKNEKQQDPHVHAGFEVTMKEQSFEIPSVRTSMKRQDWSYKIPQTTMRRQDISFNSTASRMVDKKIGQYPVEKCEWKIGWRLGVKTKFWDCTTTWKDIITKVPEFYTETKKMAFDLPEVAMRETKTSFSIPEVRVIMQKVIMKLPSVTLKSIGINSDGSAPDEERAKREAEVRAEASQQRIAQAITQAQTDGTQAMVAPIHDFFSCTATSLSAQREAIKNSYDAGVAQLEAANALLIAQGAGDTPEATSYKSSIKDLKAQASVQLDELDKQIAGLNSAEMELIRGLEGKLQVPTQETVASQK